LDLKDEAPNSLPGAALFLFFNDVFCDDLTTFKKTVWCHVVAQMGLASDGILRQGFCGQRIMRTALSSSGT
jgi:hypothetical protein